MNHLFARVCRAILVLAAALPCAAANPKPATPSAAAPEALRRLMDGNARFVSGKPIHPNQSRRRQIALAGGQSPFAAILSCSDSRVPPELIFDRGLGDLFVVRTAGNFTSDAATASFEYAVDQLRTPLIFVLGHSSCGAVKAAAAGGDLPGKLPAILEAIKPAVDAVAGHPGDLVENATRENVLRQVAALRAAAPILSSAVGEHRLEVVGGIYDVKTGKVRLLAAP